MRKLKYAVTFLLLGLGLARADDGWHLLIEPTFMHYDITWPIAGSDQTALVPARLVNGTIVPLHRDNRARVHIDRKAMLEAATKVLASLKPEFVRDSKGVIEYAVLTSDSPLTASAVLAPEFEERFADTIGPDMLIAIPNRNKVYLFPKLTQVYLEMSETIVVEYQSSTYPVSREFFSLKNGRLSAMGRFQ